MNGITHRLLWALSAAALLAVTGCTDKGNPVEPTTTSPSPTTVHTSEPMVPGPSSASASPPPSMEPR